MTSLALDYAALLDRATLGAFFAISGFHKAFHPVRRATLRETFRADGVTLPGVLYVIPAGELMGGLAILAGFLTPLAVAGLAVICTGACVLDGFKRIAAWRPLDRADWLDDVLYLPEVLYVVMLVILALIGPGRFSADAYLFPYLYR